MRRIGLCLTVLATLAMPAFFIGCGASPEPASSSAGHSDHDGHDHGDHADHDHADHDHDGDGHADHEAKDHK